MYAYLLPRLPGDLLLDAMTRLNQLRRRLGGCAAFKSVFGGARRPAEPPENSRPKSRRKMV